jgi:hypothetical protein
MAYTPGFGVTMKFPAIGEKLIVTPKPGVYAIFDDRRKLPTLVERSAAKKASLSD